MKLLITGATGLVGRAIVELSNKKGVPVNYLTTKKSKIIRNENFKGYYWDPNTHEIDLECFNGVSAIINLAGAGVSKKWSKKYKQEILLSRVNSIKTLYSALGKIDSKGITSLVSASAIGIYPSSLSKFYTEKEQGIDDSFLGEVVGKWEKEINTLNDFGFAVAKIRIGMVLSTEGGALPSLTKPIKGFLGAAFGSGKQWQSWIHISDLARMFLFVSDNNLKGTYNGVSPNPITNKKMVKEIANTLKVPIFLPNIPKFAMKVLLGEMSYLLFASQRASSKKISKEGFIFRYPNLANALQNFYNDNGDEKLQNGIPAEEFLS